MALAELEITALQSLSEGQRVAMTAIHYRRRRFEENDLPLLTKLRKTMPNDTRIAFYRAHTLWAMHRFEEAYAAYDERLKMANVSRSNPVRLLSAPDPRLSSRMRRNDWCTACNH